MQQEKRDWKGDVKIFRERMGGMTDARKAWQKEQRDTEKAIHNVLKSGPHTIPEISSESQLPAERIVWHLMALKRYGKIAEADLAGDYYRYVWKEESP